MNLAAERILQMQFKLKPIERNWLLACRAMLLQVYSSTNVSCDKPTNERTVGDYLIRPFTASTLKIEKKMFLRIFSLRLRRMLKCNKWNRACSNDEATSFPNDRFAFLLTFSFPIKKSWEREHHSHMTQYRLTNFSILNFALFLSFFNDV